MQNSPKSDLNFLFQQRSTQKTAFIRHHYASSVANGQSGQHSRHRRRIPTGIIGKLIAKLSGKTGKIAATASKSDDIFVGTAKGKMKPQKGMSVSPIPHYFQSWTNSKPRDSARTLLQIARVRPPALCLLRGPRRKRSGQKDEGKCTDGDKSGIGRRGSRHGHLVLWSGECRWERDEANVFGKLNLKAIPFYFFLALYVAFIVGGVLIVLILALSLLFYLFLCRKRKKGYYAVNEQLASAFAKKVLFYLFC